MTGQKSFLIAGMTAVCGVAFLVGCGSKTEQGSVPADPASAAPTANQAAPAAAPAPAPVATLPAFSQTKLAEAQAAMNAKNYEQAAQRMLDLQQQQAAQAAMTQAQAAQVAAHMQQFQRDLMSAVAAGDPNAIAAAQKLRQASTPR